MSSSSVPRRKISKRKTYSKLIHEAFQENRNQPMTLDQLYAWFEENGREGMSWCKSSIRHNLCVNKVGNNNFIANGLQSLPSKSLLDTNSRHASDHHEAYQNLI